ncbi:hypothetical protein [Kribbella qitaiheensis]|uniref:hypothetical protein n=1 Tax=Kribbella qitaiheensis TaxID=1544730 RepID=UPI00162ABEAB|nr:hypothetical protein [Kribbella qitaiheensis]
MSTQPHRAADRNPPRNDALVAERGIGAYSSETYRQVESFLDTLEQRLVSM